MTFGRAYDQVQVEFNRSRLAGNSNSNSGHDDECQAWRGSGCHDGGASGAAVYGGSQRATPSVEAETQRDYY